MKLVRVLSVLVLLLTLVLCGQATEDIPQGASRARIKLDLSATTLEELPTDFAFVVTMDVVSTAQIDISRVDIQTITGGPTTDDGVVQVVLDILPGGEGTLLSTAAYLAFYNAVAAETLAGGYSEYYVEIKLICSDGNIKNTTCTRKPPIDYVQWIIYSISALFATFFICIVVTRYWDKCQARYGHSPEKKKQPKQLRGVVPGKNRAGKVRRKPQKFTVGPDAIGNLMVNSHSSKSRSKGLGTRKKSSGAGVPSLFSLMTDVDRRKPKSSRKRLTESVSMPAGNRGPPKTKRRMSKRLSKRQSAKTSRRTSERR